MLKLKFLITTCLPASLTTVAKCVVTILGIELTNDMCLLEFAMSVYPLCLVLHFIVNQAILLHVTKSYQGVNFPYQHFPE